MDAFGTRHPSTDLLVWFGDALRDGAVALRALAARVDARLALRKRTADDLEVLSGMSDRELHDIGISRASVHAIATNVWVRDVLD